jgi:hypothetical protein
MHLARESVRRQPLGHRVGVQEGPIDSLGRRPQDSVKTYGVWHGLILRIGIAYRDDCRRLSSAIIQFRRDLPVIKPYQAVILNRETKSAILNGRLKWTNTLKKLIPTLADSSSAAD